MPNPNPTTDIEPSKVIPRNTNEPKVKPGVPRQSVHERALPKRFDDECAAAEADCWVDVTRKKERQLDFAMAHQSVLFQVNEISSKSDGGSPNAKRKS